MKKIWICFIGLFLSACFAGTSQTPLFYSLSAKNQHVKQYNNSFSINIENAHIPESIDKPQIITVDSNGVKIQINEFHRWSEPLDSMISQTLALDLSRQFPKAKIKNGADVFETFSYTISLDVVQFTGTLGGTTTLDAWWRIQDINNKTLYDGHTVVQKSTGNSFTDLVQTQSDLIAQIAKDIAQKMAQY